MRQYSADLVTVLWMGLKLHEGLAAGTFIQPKRNAPTWSQKPDGYGHTIRLYSPDRSGTLTMIFDQESKQHTQLTALGNTDQILQSIVGPLIITDGSTLEIVTYSAAYIQTLPDPSKGTGATTIPWVWNFDTVRQQTFDPNRATVGN